jgi:hypothetical protein
MKTRQPGPAADLFTQPPPVVLLCTAEKVARRRLAVARLSRRPPGFDPLELRLGLRALNRQNRPGYAKSNPRYHALLQRHPQLDDSLPGVAWLRVVYFQHGDLLALSSSRRALAEREARHEAEIARSSGRQHQQPADLFTQEPAA